MIKEYNVMITITTTIWAYTEDECVDLANDLSTIAEDPATEIVEMQVLDWCEA